MPADTPRLAADRQISLPEPVLNASVKYNPHLWGDEELRSIFVVRRQELATLLNALRTTAPESVPQHLLITGHRGMGKSTLLRRVALAVREDEGLSGQWLALSFPEEQYTVSTLAEFWQNVLDALVDSLEQQGQSPEELNRLDAAIHEIGNQSASQREESALALITDCIARFGKRILLLIDSTDLLLAGLAGSGDGRKSGGSNATPLWRLRKTLSHETGIFWLGASYQALESEHQYQDAFLDFFHPIELRPLSVDDMREAMLALARTFGMAGQHGEAAEQAMMRALHTRPERLKVLRAMTGGNPRTTVMLYDLFAAGDGGNVHSDLRGLLDMMTPLYKARMESLPEQPRKLLAHLMELWAPQGARELAEAAGIPNTTVSGQLSRLENEGLVEKVRLPGTRRTGFQVAERFFNVWYLMRYASRRLRQRLTWLVEFMRLWFSADELVDMAERRCCRHGQGELCDTQGLEYSRALAAALPDGHSGRYRLEWSVFTAVREARDKLRSTLGELFDLDGEEKEFTTADDYLRRFHALDEKLRRCPHVAPEEMDAWIAKVKGSLFDTLGQKEGMAEKCAELSSEEFQEVNALYAAQERVKDELGGESYAVISHAIRSGAFFPDFPDSKLAYKQIVALFSSDVRVLRLILKLFEWKHQDAWVEKVYRKALERDNDNADLWCRFGYLLHYHLGRYVEAETAYRKGIELDEKYVWAWNNLGILLKNHLGRYTEAEAAYRTAIDLDENDPSLWNNLGALLADHFGCYAEAEAAYRKAIEVDAATPYPKANLARMLACHGDRNETTSLFREVLTLADSTHHNLILQAHLWLGNLDLARQAQDALAQQAAAGDKWAFFRLREQVRECFSIGLGKALATLMDNSAYAEFLKPLSLALRAAVAGNDDALAAAPSEVAALAREVFAEIQKQAARVGK